jgi:hypothetical protein
MQAIYQDNMPSNYIHTVIIYILCYNRLSSIANMFTKPSGKCLAPKASSITVLLCFVSGEIKLQGVGHQLFIEKKRTHKTELQLTV